MPGLHHVTAIAGNPLRNLDFYRRTLSLRLVKRTVNFRSAIPATRPVGRARSSRSPLTSRALQSTSPSTHLAAR
jgi:catechol 2,3-dioxygenase-like lactoylglutathione lyase family enzyme